MSEPQLGDNDETNVYCGLCDWDRPITSFEHAEALLQTHLRECHGVKLAYARDVETGEIKPTPDGDCQ